MVISKDVVLEQVEITDPPIRTLMVYTILPQSLGCSDTDSASIVNQKLARWVPSRFSEENLKMISYSDQGKDHFIFLTKVENKIYDFSTDCLVNHELMIGATLKSYSWYVLIMMVVFIVRWCIGKRYSHWLLSSKKRKKQILIGFDMPFIPELPSFKWHLLKSTYCWSRKRFKL